MWTRVQGFGNLKRIEKTHVNIPYNTENRNFDFLYALTVQ